MKTGSTSSGVLRIRIGNSSPAPFHVRNALKPDSRSEHWHLSRRANIESDGGHSGVIAEAAARALICLPRPRGEQAGWQIGHRWAPKRDRHKAVNHLSLNTKIEL